MEGEDLFRMMCNEYTCDTLYLKNGRVLGSEDS